MTSETSVLRRLSVAAAAIVCTACQDGFDDTGRITAPPMFVARSATASTPQIFAPGVISDGRWQWRLTFTPDGKVAYFTASPGWFPATRSATIHLSRLRDDGTWSTPEVAPFSGTYSDIDPFITPDGSRLYFSSIRPLNGIPKPDLDVWYVDRLSSGGWSTPVRMGPEINSDLDELYPSASAKGTLFFASGPFGPTPSADWNIYFSERVGSSFSIRHPVTAVNTDLPFDPANPTADWEFNPEISADGRTLLFTSLRPGGFGFGDLYVSQFRNGKWMAPTNLGPTVNTTDDEFHPTLSRDRRTLYFARTIFSPTLVPSDFYSVSTQGLGVTPP
jgi:hypothetical protein